MGALIITPKPEHQGQSRTPASTLKVYPSSVGPVLTLYMFREEQHPLFASGLRLDRDQARVLWLNLGAYLSRGDIEDAQA